MKRVFTSFAIEDRILRDFLVGQKNNARSQISFVDYSVKEPWSSSWKTNCRERIRQCAGMIGIITHNTPQADGQMWELKCGAEEGLPVLLIHGYSDYFKRLWTAPSPMSHHPIHDWSEANVVRFLDRLP